MLPHLSYPRALLALLLTLALLLPSARADAQGADVDQWRAGDPALNDNFSRDTGQWSVDSGRDALSGIGRGRLSIEVPEAELFRWVTLDTGAAYSDFYVEVDAGKIEGPDDAMIGVVFRYADEDNFYAFLTSADGYYALIKYVDGELTRLVDWAETDALDTGDVANALGVLAVGRELAIFANEEELDRVTDRSFTEGQIALLAGTNADGELVAGFDNFTLWTGDAGTTPGRKTLRRSTPTPGAAPAPQRPAPLADAVVTADALNVRGGPGANYPIVGSLKRGDEVTIVGRSADSKWAKLGFSNVAEAWASAQYLAINIDFAQAPVAVAPPPPTPRPTPRAAQPAQPARPAGNVAWLVIENHIGRFITVQVNDKNFRVEGKVGETAGRYQFELQGVGRYKVAAQLPNGGGHNWDLYIEPTADRCANRQGCIALGQTFLQTYY